MMTTTGTIGNEHRKKYPLRENFCPKGRAGGEVITLCRIYFVGLIFVENEMINIFPEIPGSLFSITEMLVEVLESSV